MGHASIAHLQILAPHRAESPEDLHIGVIFTDFEDTKAALKTASTLAAGLHADIDLVVPHIVPFPLALAHPSVPPGFTLRRLSDMAAAAEVQPSILVYFCRDPLETLLQVLDPHSIVVVGSRKRWFPTKPERLAGKLRKNGHHVIVAKHT